MSLKCLFRGGWTILQKTGCKKNADYLQLCCFILYFWGMGQFDIDNVVYTNILLSEDNRIAPYKATSIFRGGFLIWVNRRMQWN